MKRKYRLLKEQEFKKVLFLKKQKIITKSLITSYLKNNLDHSRIGIIVPKKFFKKAVVRNYYRRVIREAARMEEFLKLKNYDCVFYCKKEISNQFNFSKLREEISTIIIKLKAK